MFHETPAEDVIRMLRTGASKAWHYKPTYSYEFPRLKALVELEADKDKFKFEPSNVGGDEYVRVSYETEDPELCGLIG